MNELTCSVFLYPILMQVQIIRDNLISSLNHCDLVYSVSLACPIPLFPSITFTISIFFFPYSAAVSELCISITSATQDFKCSLLSLILCLSPFCLLQFPRQARLHPQWQPITGQMRENYCKVIKLYSRSYYLHTERWILNTAFTTLIMLHV